MYISSNSQLILFSAFQIKTFYYTFGFNLNFKGLHITIYNIHITFPTATSLYFYVLLWKSPPTFAFNTSYWSKEGQLPNFHKQIAFVYNYNGTDIFCQSRCCCYIFMCEYMRFGRMIYSTYIPKYLYYITNKYISVIFHFHLKLLLYKKIQARKTISQNCKYLFWRSVCVNSILIYC